MDNGFTWAYHIDFDPNAGGTVDQDDAGLVIGMGDMGTIGIYVSEGGLSKEYGWGIGALGTGSDWAGVSAQIKGYDVSNNENIQYHLPSDLLPFGIGAKVAYAPETTEADSQDKKSDGSIVGVSKDGENATHYQITAAPLDGLANVLIITKQVMQQAHTKIKNLVTFMLSTQWVTFLQELVTLK
jgi:hypothetical protein